MYSLVFPIILNYQHHHRVKVSFDGCVHLHLLGLLIVVVGLCLCDVGTHHDVE